MLVEGDKEIALTLRYVQNTRRERRYSKHAQVLIKFTPKKSSSYVIRLSADKKTFYSAVYDTTLGIPMPTDYTEYKHDDPHNDRHGFKGSYCKDNVVIGSNK